MGDGGGGGCGPHSSQVFLHLRFFLSGYLSHSFFLHFSPSLSAHADGLGGGGGGGGSGNGDGGGFNGDGDGDGSHKPQVFRHFAFFGSG